jgi:FAD/FMN-containing dehydrogenase
MDPTLIALQKRIKQAFDPLNILNPGKIFPT